MTPSEREKSNIVSPQDLSKRDQCTRTPNLTDGPRIPNIIQRIPRQQNQIRALPDLNGTAILQPKIPGRQHGRGPQGLETRQAGLNQELELLMQGLAMAHRHGRRGLDMGI